MDLTNILILSTVEGVTEFLPISSTAHLILTSHILSIPQTTFLETFQVAIQVGAIGAATVYYFHKIWKNKKLFYKACIGFIPTGILGLLFLKQIKVLLASPIIPAVTLLIGGVLIIAIEMYFKQAQKREKNTKSLESMTYKDALLIGLIQSISMIPGVSRAAASIFGGMALKLDRKAATEFSFILAIPTMVVATGVELLKNSKDLSSRDYPLLGIGILLSFVTALFVIRWLLKYVQSHDFTLFGVYRIVVSLLYFFFFLR